MIAKPDYKTLFVLSFTLCELILIFKIGFWSEQDWISSLGQDWESQISLILVFNEKGWGQRDGRLKAYKLLPAYATRRPVKKHANLPAYATAGYKACNMLATYGGNQPTRRDGR
jgi:hypothetical protein